MDKESISRVGLDYIHGIDYEASDEIYDPATTNHIIKLRLIKDKDICCPRCGRRDTVYARSSVRQEINHSSANEKNIIIQLHRIIYRCECGHVFKEPNPFLTDKRKNTIMREIQILNELKDLTKSFSDVAHEFNVSTTTIMNIFDAKVDIPRQLLTEVLCVDEVYSKHCGFHHYCFVVYSPQKDKILDVLPMRNKKELIEYFLYIPASKRDRVKFFSMDMYEVYKEVAEKCFPNALICVDHFHVNKNLTDDFNKARIRIMKKYEHLKGQNDSWYWLYKKYWKLLLKSPERLKYERFRVSKSGMYLSEHEIVDYMLTIDKDLKDGYELLNEYRNFNSVAKSEEAAEMLDDLITKFHNSPLPEFYQASKMLKRWRQEIINSYNRINGHIISNGGMERKNRDIKTLFRHAFGFMNFTRLRNRIMFALNKDASILNGRKKKEKKK